MPFIERSWDASENVVDLMPFLRESVHSWVACDLVEVNRMMEDIPDRVESAAEMSFTQDSQDSGTQ